jgi:hypothetical protein
MKPGVKRKLVVGLVLAGIMLALLGYWLYREAKNTVELRDSAFWIGFYYGKYHKEKGQWPVSKDEAVAFARSSPQRLPYIDQVELFTVKPGYGFDVLIKEAESWSTDVDAYKHAQENALTLSPIHLPGNTSEFRQWEYFREFASGLYVGATTADTTNKQPASQ